MKAGCAMDKTADNSNLATHPDSGNSGVCLKAMVRALAKQQAQIDHDYRVANETSSDIRKVQ